MMLLLKMTELHLRGSCYVDNWKKKTAYMCPVVQPRRVAAGPLLVLSKLMFTSRERAHSRRYPELIFLIWSRVQRGSGHVFFLPTRRLECRGAHSFPYIPASSARILRSLFPPQLLSTYYLRLLLFLHHVPNLPAARLG